LVSVGHSKAQLNAGRNVRGRAPDILPPGLDEARSRAAWPDDRRVSLEFWAFVVLASIAAAWLTTIHFNSLLRGDMDTKVVVERIIRVESNGNSKAKNSRSSATGAGQILDQTWLEMIQRHRQDLVAGRTSNDLLELRGDPALTREIVARMVEGNARRFRKRGLPVTPGTLYLAHFAGYAGAVALLTSADDLDAASLLAGADASGRSSREQLVKANPFLAKFTVGDLKFWADRKMRG
jgi:hypothetical protein